MQVITLDFESYYDDTYTLKKETTESYVRDPRFEALCLGVVMPDNTSFFVPQEHLHAWFASIDWTRTAVLGHHMHFDGLILAHHFGVRPAFIFDSLSVARAKLGNHVRKSLEALAAHFGLGVKSVPYGMFKGRRWANLYPHERAAIGEGAVNDCRLTKQIFGELVRDFPTEELEIIDMTVRMFTEPQVYGDTPMLDGIVQHEEDRKRALLMQLGVTDEDLQSSDRFVKLLEELGVDAEWKPGKPLPDGTPKWIPAIAKTDDFMKALLASPDEMVATLAEARLAVRSTLAEARAGRMAAMSRRGAMCVYLAYAAAHTLRFGGGDSVNWQNLPRVKPGGNPQLEMRGAIAAPADHMIVAPDSSQIECRTVNWLAGEEDVLDAFRNKRDVYAEAASRFYKIPIDKKSHPLERQLFKQVELGSGYGLGAERFAVYARSGVGGPPIHLTLEQSQAAIQFYRDTHPNVVQLWATARRMIPFLGGAGGSYPLQLGPCKIYEGYVEGPNGLRLLYPEMDFNRDGFEGWSYRTRNGRTKIYGGKLVENCLADGTLIATDQGWIPIEQVTTQRIWDGVEWVDHTGVVCNGVQSTLSVDGVRMTPEHKVLTDAVGWQEASQLEGLVRTKVWFPDGEALRDVKKREVAMARRVRMRHEANASFLRVQRLETPKLRLQAWGTYREVTSYSRDVEASRLWRLAVDGGSVPPEIASRIPQVWRSGHYRVQEVAEELCEILGRHGVELQTWFDARSQEQRWALYVEKLSLGDAPRASKEYQEQLARQTGQSFDDSDRGGADHWYKVHHVSLPLSQRLVFDVTNCGPRNRFVVRSEEGPMIVHNCVQHLARVVVTQAQIRIKRQTGLRPWLSTHDDLAYIVHKSVAKDANEYMINEMRKPPEWMPDIPLDAEGEPSERYVK